MNFFLIMVAPFLTIVISIAILFIWGARQPKS
ncbi:cytochrome bd oxidase small subunit CydS [Alkalihalobacterium elongatum]